MAAQLRLYSTSRESARVEMPPPRVTVRLGDLLPLIAVAQRNNYLWLQDFLEDEVSITDDLYEVIRAFQCYRPSA
jgi:hypothetical protein